MPEQVKATYKRPYIIGESPAGSEAFLVLANAFGDSFNRSEAESVLQVDMNIGPEEAKRLFNNLLRSGAVVTEFKESHYL